MSSRLCSSRMLARCSRSSYVRHWCVFPSVDCHWHRYVFLMACAPYLSFLMAIFSLVMVWIVCPRIGCDGGLGACMLFVGICCDVGGWFVCGIRGGVGGNNSVVCCNASLMVLDLVL